MRQGWIAPEVAAEFPDLRLHEVQLALPRGIGRSSDGIRQRLRDLSDRFTGAQAIAMRTQPIHHAQRVFFRHIGLDPDRDRPPAEAIAVERLRAGHFRSTDALSDAIVIAVMETGVPVWALDDAPLAGGLGIRPGDDGRLVVADAVQPVAVLFGDVLFPPAREARAVRLFSVQLAGIPSIHVEEALWTVCESFDAEL